jgi:hypothetical protein
MLFQINNLQSFQLTILLHLTAVTPGDGALPCLEIGSLLVILIRQRIFFHFGLTITVFDCLANLFLFFC